MGNPTCHTSTVLVIPLSTSTMSAVAPSRLAALKQLQCSIFQTSYNPTSIRTGAKYLRARLRGPSMVQYYPTEISIARLARNPRRGIVNLEEEQRLRDVEDKKKRGKGAPRKAKTKGVSLASPLCYIETWSLTTISSLRGESAVDPETMNACTYHTYTVAWACPLPTQYLFKLLALEEHVSSLCFLQFSCALERSIHAFATPAYLSEMTASS